ncbi:hypothetical protein ANTPLA_LOCUS9524 [Anthophora plagiata]
MCSTTKIQVYKKRGTTVSSKKNKKYFFLRAIGKIFTQMLFVKVHRLFMVLKGAPKWNRHETIGFHLPSHLRPCLNRPYNKEPQ